MRSDTAYTPGSFFIDRPVFFGAIAILIALIGFAGSFPEASATMFSSIQALIVKYASWYYVLVVGIILVCVLFLAFSRLGDIKLGPDHSTPAYSNVSWFAMLFSAGMGIGLMFYGVAEPVMHFMQPPQGEGQTVAAAGEAMRLTFFHWGIHAWSIYAIVALILGYFSHRHGLPLTLRSALYPLIGERIYGRIGAAVDVFAILGTLCGIATSLGLGVVQINSGLNVLFGVEVSTAVQVVLIIITIGLATLSVVMGLDAGIKRLSEINIGLAGLLLLGVLFAGPTIFILQSFLQNVGDYLSELIHKTTNLYAYRPTSWLGGWTILYWGWWLSWAPFVGLFIARISRGRTIRQFIVGAMLVPCAFNLFWMSVFGSSAISMILDGTLPELGNTVYSNQAVALFNFLEAFPFSRVLSVISLVMVVVFFVTSADSGAMILNMLSAKGRDDTSLFQRILWSVMIGMVTIVLLYAGGLSSLQTASIIGALPFSLALLWAMWGFFKALHLDYTKREVQAGSPAVAPVVVGASTVSWQSRLSSLLRFPGDKQVLKFQQRVALPALQQFASELQKNDVSCRVVDEIQAGQRVRLEVYHGNELDFVYEVRCRHHRMPDGGFNAPSEVPTDPDTPENVYFRAEVHLSEGGQDYDVMGWNQEQLVLDVLQRYENHLHFLHSVY
ncbi:MAG TPA: BCCT family transporter [Pseudomonadales bacterium]|nr:BCCT family transporter [Pseudomonadales bacterium]